MEAKAEEVWSESEEMPPQEPAPEEKETKKRRKVPEPEPEQKEEIDPKKKRIPRFIESKKNRKALATYLNKGIVEFDPSVKASIKRKSILKNVSEGDHAYSVADICGGFVKLMRKKYRETLTQSFSVPHILILEMGCYSVISAFGQLKTLLNKPEFRRDGDVVVKLHQVFAKHKKLEMQASEFRQTAKGRRVVNVIVGTPNRICRLIECKALDPTGLKYLILDCTPNAKKQTLLDYRESHRDVFELLSKGLLGSILAGGVKIYFQ